MTIQVAAARQPAYPPYPSAAPDAGLLVRQPDKALQILRMKQLVERTKLSRATLYALIASDPTFPRKIQLTTRTVGWLESEVDAWISSRASSRPIA